jgi:hypothetical protein
MKTLALLIVLTVTACGPQMAREPSGVWTAANPGMWVPTQAEIQELPQ